MPIYLLSYDYGDLKKGEATGRLTLAGVSSHEDFVAVLEFIRHRNGGGTSVASLLTSSNPVDIRSIDVSKLPPAPEKRPPAQPIRVETQPPTPTRAAAPAEVAKDKAPALPEKEPVENGDSAYFRLPTVKAIVKLLSERGVQGKTAILQRCSELQGIGVPALDVIPPEDLDTRVEAAMAALNV